MNDNRGTACRAWQILLLDLPCRIFLKDEFVAKFVVTDNLVFVKKQLVAFKTQNLDTLLQKKTQEGWDTVNMLTILILNVKLLGLTTGLKWISMKHNLKASIDTNIRIY